MEQIVCVCVCALQKGMISPLPSPPSPPLPLPLPLPFPLLLFSPPVETDNNEHRQDLKAEAGGAEREGVEGEDHASPSAGSIVGTLLRKVM